MLARFCYCFFKIFEYFCCFLKLTIITGKRNFLSLTDGLPDITPETKIVDGFERFFTTKSEIFFKFCNIFLIDLFTNMVRKLKVAESNQAKASLAKLWLATDKANRSPVV